MVEDPIILIAIVNGVWFILPAYIANASAVLFGGRAPMDFNRSFFDKRRIFGDGKTFTGFVGAVAAGTLCGWVQGYLQSMYGFAMQYQVTLELGFVLALGAMTGDLAGSFIKRRIGIEPGKSIILLDQLGFVVGAFIFAYGILRVIPSPLVVVVIIIITPLIHLASNRVAHMLKLKKYPW